MLVYSCVYHYVLYRYPPPNRDSLSRALCAQFNAANRQLEVIMDDQQPAPRRSAHPVVSLSNSDARCVHPAICLKQNAVAVHICPPAACDRVEGPPRVFQTMLQSFNDKVPDGMSVVSVCYAFVSDAADLPA